MTTSHPSLESIQAELDRFKSTVDLQKEIATLRSEVTLQLSHFKWVAWTAGAIIAVLSFFGVKAWSDLTGSAQKLYEKQLVEMQDRYSNLSRGFSLVDSGRTKDAIPYLTPLYEANRYDDPVVRGLLFALSDIVDCDEGPKRVEEIRKDEARFLRFKDPQIFNLSGIVLRDCYSGDASMLDEARKLFEISLKHLSADDPERRYPLYSLFSYYFLRGDMQSAESYLRSASAIREDYPPVGGLLEDPWVKDMRRRNDVNVGKLKPMFDRILKGREQQSPK